MYFRKKYIEKYDLQESYDNFKIKVTIFLCESGPRIRERTRWGIGGIDCNLYCSVVTVIDLQSNQK